HEVTEGVPPTAGAHARRRADLVEITVVGSVADYQRLIAPIGARTPSGVPLLWNRIDRFNPLAELLRAESPPTASVALRCWIDLSDLRRVTLYLAGRRGERCLARRGGAVLRDRGGGSVAAARAGTWCHAVAAERAERRRDRTGGGRFGAARGILGRGTLPHTGQRACSRHRRPPASAGRARRRGG